MPSRNSAERWPACCLCALAPPTGISFLLSERWYGLRNRYYRWKRRHAARKFEVYMRCRAAR